jgi:outer membrane protein assembly factor BamD (BamD/ComL family)
MRKVVFLILASIFIISGLSCTTLEKPRVHRELTGRQKEQAERWLNTGNLLSEAGEYDSASEYYERIITYYPGTRYFYEAKDKIEKIEQIEEAVDR